MFLVLPFHLTLKTDLEAVKRLDNLPFASNLIPATFLYFKEFTNKFSILSLIFFFLFLFIVLDFKDKLSNKRLFNKSLSLL